MSHSILSHISSQALHCSCIRYVGNAHTCDLISPYPYFLLPPLSFLCPLPSIISLSSPPLLLLLLLFLLSLSLYLSITQSYVRTTGLGLIYVWRGIAMFSWVRLSIFALRVNDVLRRKKEESRNNATA